MSSWVREVVRFLLCACALWAALPAPTRAEPLRALLRITQPHDVPLYERVRGQTSDLELELVRHETGPLEASIAEQLASARLLGGSQRAQIVIWFARERPEQLEVRVLDLAAERVLSRPIERGAGALGESAQDEAAALVVRSAARASLLGAALGTPEQELAEPSVPIVVERPAPEPVQAEPATTGPGPSAVRFVVGAGAHGAFDGAARFGLGLRMAIALASLELGARAGYGFASRTSTSVAQVELAQHRAGLYAAFAPMLGGWLQLALELGVDLQVFTTSVRVDDPLFDGRAPRALLPGASAQVGARIWLHPRCALAIGAGIELLPNTPVLGYESGAGFVRVREPWSVQPLLALELVTRF